MSGLWSSAEALHIEKSQKPPCLIEDPWGRRFWIFSNRFFCSDFTTKFLNIKSLLRDHKGTNVSLAKSQSRSNVKETTCNTLFCLDHCMSNSLRKFQRFKQLKPFNRFVSWVILCRTRQADALVFSASLLLLVTNRLWKLSTATAAESSSGLDKSKTRARFNHACFDCKIRLSSYIPACPEQWQNLALSTTIGRGPVAFRF